MQAWQCVQICAAYVWQSRGCRQHHCQCWLHGAASGQLVQIGVKQLLLLLLLLLLLAWSFSAERRHNLEKAATFAGRSWACNKSFLRCDARSLRQEGRSRCAAHRPWCSAAAA